MYMAANFCGNEIFVYFVRFLIHEALICLCLFCPENLPYLMIVDWCLITSYDVSIREYIIGTTLAQFKTTTVLTSQDHRLITQLRSINGAI